MTTLIEYLARFCALLFVLVPHEFAHAYVAYKNGDGTAKMMGRMTLNPIKHLDPVGFIACALVGFGWAKPVPVNSYNFRNYKVGMFTTAIAGVVTNYIIAFLVYPILLVLQKFYFGIAPDSFLWYLSYFGQSLCLFIYMFSLASFVINLLPLYPLDGFRVVEAFTRAVNPVHKFLREYGTAILVILVAESFICDLLVRYGVGWATYCDVLGWVMTFATKYVGFPINAAWGWI